MHSSGDSELLEVAGSTVAYTVSLVGVDLLWNNPMPCLSLALFYDAISGVNREQSSIAGLNVEILYVIAASRLNSFLTMF